MSNGLTIAPHYNTGFVIVPPPPVDETEHPLQFSFYGFDHGDTHRVADRRGHYYIGCLVGDPYRDDNFRKKLERARAILDLRGVSHRQEVCRLNYREVVRLSNEQKYRRALAKLKNEYNRRREELAGNIFANQFSSELEKAYNQALAKIKSKYCIND